MTTKQLAKLQTIISKIEALQATLSSADPLYGTIMEGKNRLLKAENEAYHQKNR